MQKKSKRSRAGVLAIGALVGTVLSVGAVSTSASAAKPEPKPAATVEVSVGVGGGSVSLMSGIRW